MGFALWVLHNLPWIMKHERNRFKVLRLASRSSFYNTSRGTPSIRLTSQSARD